MKNGRARPWSGFAFRNGARQHLAGREWELWLLGLAALALFAIAAMQVEQHKQVSRSRQHVAQAVVALQSIDNITNLLLRAETAQRGYLLTGSPTYLRPYGPAVREMAAALEDFERAEQKIAIDPEQVNRIQSLVKAKLDEMSQTLDIYDRQSSTRALDLVRTNLGRQLMDQFSEAVATAKRASVQVFTQEFQQLEDRGRGALYLSSIGVLIVGGVLVIAALRLHSSFRTYQELLVRIQSAGEQYRLLVRRLESVREEERAHLAREIHDAFGQTLTVIKLDLAVATRRISGQPDVPGITGKLNQASASLDKAIHSLRRVAAELRPPLLDTAGLGPALEAYLRELQERTGLQIRFTASPELPALASEQRIVAFRICQESLTNVVRHAAASDVDVTLISEPNELRLVVRDNGLGFVNDGAAGERSLGLLGMRERAQLVDGEISIKSHPGRGTTVTLRMPMLERSLAQRP